MWVNGSSVKLSGLGNAVLGCGGLVITDISYLLCPVLAFWSIEERAVRPRFEQETVGWGTLGICTAMVTSPEC